MNDDDWYVIFSPEGKYIQVRFKDRFKVCHNCLIKSSEDFLVCAGCQIQAYCTISCQRADWKTHKLHCQRNKRSFDKAINEKNGGNV